MCHCLLDNYIREIFEGASFIVLGHFDDSHVMPNEKCCHAQEVSFLMGALACWAVPKQPQTHFEIICHPMFA